jgi:FMN phosphatase YigB (HAD superfamily)
MPVRAVVFDLFGTLVDDAPPADYSEFLAESARLLGADPQRFATLWSAHDVERFTGPIETCFEAISAELGLSDPARLADVIAYRFERMRRGLVPRPDAEETLRTLRARLSSRDDQQRQQ